MAKRQARTDSASKVAFSLKKPGELAGQRILQRIPSAARREVVPVRTASSDIF
jgi:hypothetical protein